MTCVEAQSFCARTVGGRNAPLVGSRRKVNLLNAPPFTNRCPRYSTAPPGPVIRTQIPESGPADLRTSVRGGVRDEASARNTPAAIAAIKTTSPKRTERRSLGTALLAAGQTGIAAVPEGSDIERAARLPARRAACRDRRGRIAAAAGGIDRPAMASIPPPPSSSTSNSDHHHKKPAATSSSTTYLSAAVPRGDRRSVSVAAGSMEAVRRRRTKPPRSVRSPSVPRRRINPVLSIKYERGLSRPAPGTQSSRRRSEARNLRRPQSSLRRTS